MANYIPSDLNPPQLALYRPDFSGQLEAQMSLGRGIGDQGMRDVQAAATGYAIGSDIRGRRDQNMQDQDLRSAIAGSIDPRTGRVDRGKLSQLLYNVNPKLGLQYDDDLRKSQMEEQRAAAVQQMLGMGGAGNGQSAGTGVTDPNAWAKFGVMTKDPTALSYAGQLADQQRWNQDVIERNVGGRPVTGERERIRSYLQGGGGQQSPFAGGRQQDIGGVYRPAENQSQADRIKQMDPLIMDAANRYGVDWRLVKSVIQAESGGNPRATSPKGAMGVMQLMPGTAQRFGVKDPYDVQQNIEGGTKYLAFLSKRYGGDLQKVVAAYNAGEGAVDKYGGVPPYDETREYVNKVGRNYQQVADAGGGVSGGIAFGRTPEEQALAQQQALQPGQREMEAYQAGLREAAAQREAERRLTEADAKRQAELRDLPVIEQEKVRNQTNKEFTQQTIKDAQEGGKLILLADEMADARKKGFTPGPGAWAWGHLSRYFGLFDPKAATTTEGQRRIEQATSQALLSMIGGSLGYAISDNDVKMIRDQLPQIADSPMAFDALVANIRKAGESNVNKLREWQQYKTSNARTATAEEFLTGMLARNGRLPQQQPPQGPPQGLPQQPIPQQPAPQQPALPQIQAAQNPQIQQALATIQAAVQSGRMSQEEAKLHMQRLGIGGEQ